MFFNILHIECYRKLNQIDFFFENFQLFFIWEFNTDTGYIILY